MILMTCTVRHRPCFIYHTVLEAYHVFMIFIGAAGKRIVLNQSKPFIVLLQMRKCVTGRAENMHFHLLPRCVVFGML